MTIFVICIYILFILFGLFMFSKIYAVRNKSENIALAHFAITALLSVVAIIAILLLKDNNLAFLAYTCFYILYSCMMFSFYWFSMLYCKKEFSCFKSYMFYFITIENIILVLNYFYKGVFILVRDTFNSNFYWYTYSPNNFERYIYAAWLVPTIAIVINVLLKLKDAPRLYRPRYLYIAFITIAHTIYQIIATINAFPNWLKNIFVIPFVIVVIYYSVYYSDIVFKQSALLYVAENLSDGFALYGEDNKRIYINDRLNNLLTDEQRNDFLYKDAFDKWVFESTELNGILVKQISAQSNNFYFSVIPHVFIDKKAYIGTSYSLQDVTPTIERLELVEKANNELIKADHMKSDFLANMSHEIRTPMNGVIGMAEMALREEMTDEAKEYINQIKASGKVLLNIINDILDFSKIESGKFEIIPQEYEILSGIYEFSNTLMAKISDKDIELIIQTNPNIPTKLFGDNLRIRQVIINLANNAIKFTEKGCVLISIDYEKIDEDNANLIVHIKDTGIGIKAEDINKLFTSFQQVDTKRNRTIEGTGLGLAISKGLVNTMNGEIGVNSIYGEGSDFYFNIPQKVIDWTPSISIQNNNKLFAFGMFSNKYLAKRFFLDMHDFDIYSAVLKSPEEFEYTYETYEDMLYSSSPYIFFEERNYNDKLKQILIDNPDITGVMILDYGSLFKSDISNLKVYKRPLSTQLIAMAFNNEDTHTIYDYSSENDFIAPDARILVVDDNDINITIVNGLLQPLQMTIDSAKSGYAALDALKFNNYDIVFMDHMMPQMDGVETTKIIRQTMPQLKDMPIIALTANAISGVKEFFLSVGMNDFIPKPIEIREIINKVKIWLPTDKIQKSGSTSNIADTNDTYNTNNNESNNDNIFELLEGIDVAKALELLGSEQIYKTILNSYYYSIEENIEKLNNFYKNNEIPEYAILVHAVKSSSRQIGALEIGDLAYKLELAAKANDVEIIKEEHDNLIDMYLSIKQILSKVCETNKKSFDSLSLVTSDELIEILNDIINASSELDFNQIEENITKINHIRIPNDCIELFDELKKAVNMMDIDAIENVTNNMIKHLT